MWGQHLYELGARKVTVVEVGQIECLPRQISKCGSCAQEQNEAASTFDSKLRSLVSHFNSQFSGDASFIFVNITAITTLNPHFLGIEGSEVFLLPKVGVVYWALVMAVAATYYAEGKPCMYIFGDSLSEHGNNNLLPTLAKYNYPPYGIDFPFGATGRATNGRTVVDVITFAAELMGLPLIPPFANTRGSDILKGVNYASGAAGILFDTGKKMGADISMDAQIRNHGITASAIAARFGGVEAARRYLNKCLYYVNIGSNDYLNNYFMPQYYPSSHIYNLTQFTDLLIAQYSRQLRALHAVGGRKFALVSLGSIGCAPAVTAANNGSCVQQQNTAASMFNEKLRQLVDRLNSDFPANPAHLHFCQHHCHLLPQP
ncbi:GDSL esterase/lipase At4g18970-like [Neltuma alba]|uniref:GDSL esterase/lipase At4g18970-like n=1 Tax=Neltuma alba TaxID=207710 RepID=UPI0010A58FE9|nr:GDSL esterase/lipase At4g18970-like [Prosopis alba]